MFPCAFKQIVSDSIKKYASEFMEYWSLTLGWGKKFDLGTLNLYWGSEKGIHKQKAHVWMISTKLCKIIWVIGR